MARQKLHDDEIQALIDALRRLAVADEMAFIAAARTDVPALLDKIERLRTELRDKGNDLLDVRGLLSPNGGDSVLPAGFDISEQVAPAVEWLIDEVRRLRVVVEAAQAYVRAAGAEPDHQDTPGWYNLALAADLASDQLFAVVDAYEQGGES